MNYTQEMMKEDQEIAKLIFNKYFARHKHFKEDMIQHAIIELWKARANFEGKSKYSTYASRIATFAMINFFRKENRHLDNSHFDEENEDMYFSEYLFAEYIPSEQPSPMAMFYLKYFIGSLYDLLPNDKAKEIIKLYLNRRPVAEISKIVDMTQKSVYAYIKKFRADLAEALDMKELLNKVA